jgi:2-polyprenyl-6-methoxyphenol hydroxylase-like FAD-dependent oxidoreductase
VTHAHAGPRGHAVVVGASVAGLLMARALSEGFARVTVLERDRLPTAPAYRRGVVQDRQVHGLLARGRMALDELFPGMTDDLTAAGVPTGDIQSDVHWYKDGHCLKPVPSGLVGLGVSRPMLEFALRSRVSRLPGVTLTDGCEVLGLLTDPARTRVAGVRVREAGSAAGDGEMAADLVVDAGGRGTRTPVWLERLGLERAPEESVSVKVQFMSRVYRHEPHHLGGLLGCAVAASADRPRSAFALAQEGGRLILSLGSWEGDRPPIDREGSADFADMLGVPEIAEVIRTATPVRDAVRAVHPVSVRRRYSTLDSLPRDYLVAGDALCNFNPFYGQGMTVVAVEALALRDLLREGRDDLGARFLSVAERLVSSPWDLALGGDLEFPDAIGERSPETLAATAYMRRYRAAAARDGELATAFLRVTNLLDEPSRLMEPDLRARVAAG